MAPCEGVESDTNETTSRRENSGRHGNHDTGTVSPAGRFKMNPTGFDDLLKYPEKWLNGKRIDDDIGPYWRVHDKLYDLKGFKHPGGQDWIESTQGTDVTEAFESSHIHSTAENTLPKYYVKDINTPRNSPYTFHDHGFYRTLKRKVRPILKRIGTTPTRKMLLMQDGLVMTFILLAIAASMKVSYSFAICSGCVLAMTITCAHNFFHQRDNYRMYYFDFSLFSSYEWRVSHSLSHHIYTNTRYDMEMTLLEPFLVFFPIPQKTLLQRYGSHIYEFFLIPLFGYIEVIKRLCLVLSRRVCLRLENLLPVAELMVMCVLAPSVSTGFKLWLVLHAACSFWFSGIGILVAHHHPEIYHEGDATRDDPDWGLCQLDAVRDRSEITGNLFLVSTTFGDHSLHHLFPTVDHSKLNDLYPAFLDTCKEFSIPFKFLTQRELALGMYQQLRRNTPNTSPPGYH